MDNYVGEQFIGSTFFLKSIFEKYHEKCFLHLKNIPPLGNTTPSPQRPGMIVLSHTTPALQIVKVSLQTTWTTLQSLVKTLPLKWKVLFFNSILSYIRHILYILEDFLAFKRTKLTSKYCEVLILILPQYLLEFTV